jgi:hypothetical protein
MKRTIYSLTGDKMSVKKILGYVLFSIPIGTIIGLIILVSGIYAWIILGGGGLLAAMVIGGIELMS